MTSVSERAGRGARRSVRAPATRDQPSGDAGIASTTHAPRDETARRALAAFLRRMRDRAEPRGERRLARRRAAGLRREEVALDAGISVTWYTWLEQGRPVRVSRRTLGAIARALRLDATERAHLLQLAAAAAAPTPPSPTGTATPSLRALVDALAPHPAYAVNARWDVLHANAPAVATFGDFAARPGVTDNVLARLLLDEGWRTCFVDWGAVTASAIAQFRAATGRMVGDAWWKAFVARLSAESAVFREAWARHDLAAAASWEKTVRHADGTVTPYRYASLAPDAEAPDVRIVVYAAVVRA